MGEQMTSPHENRSYRKKSTVIEGRYRTDFALTCATCGTVDTIHMDPVTPPDVVLSKFTRRGWATDIRNPSACVCPSCLTGKPKTMPPETKSAEPETKAEMPKGPTVQQLKRIAEHLRGCFHAENGHYLDGQTDHTVADALGVPWGWVRAARDLLGFTIKFDPEVKSIRDEIAALAEMILALQSKLDAIERRRTNG
jgi:hypothetical protein